MPQIVESAHSGALMTFYHITDNSNFQLDPTHAPEDNAISIVDRSGNQGIYLARDVEKWVNGHGYVRPFVAEIVVDPSALEHDTVSRWGGEVFIPADQFDKIKVSRVIPLDAWAREEFGMHGWFERSLGYEFDTGEKITATDWETPFGRAYRYPKDTREMSAQEIDRIKRVFEEGRAIRGR